MSDRAAIVLGFRIGGVALMLVGLYLWLGGRITGWTGFGPVLAAVGAAGAFALPRLLRQRR